jgi:Tol biopolymer transport system component
MQHPASSSTAPLLPGTRLGSYEILAFVAAGGMGEVYRAKDLSLHRDIAIKVLPADVAADAGRRARFEREAQLAAGLNHPGIVTIHSVEHDGDRVFITMELVKGPPLADLIPHHGLPLDKLLTIAVPLANAVSAAHDNGITHRDLKPGNVIVGDDGVVKVLDFGIAKRHDVDGTTGVEATATLVTAEGRLLGTIAYMSPEQAEGKPADKRSDVFALGTMLYEMATGRRPFSADTDVATLAAIVRDSPMPIAKVNPRIPNELARIVRRAMAKDPDRRQQSAKDLRNELDELRRELEAGELTPAAAVAPRRPAAAWILATVGVVAALAAVSLWMWRDAPVAPSIRLSNPRQLTFTSGVETLPTWSPDGGRIAYVSNQNGNDDIWVVPAAGGAPVNFTADHRGNDSQPAWSPDGNQIAFVSDRDPDRGGIYVMPALGGRPERISPRGTAEGVRSPQWSADGTELAHIRREPEGNVIEIVSMATRQTRYIKVPGEQGNRFDLSWSRDGRYFAYVRAGGRDSEVNRLWVLRAGDGEAVAITDGTTGAWSPMWSADGRTLFFLSNRGGSVDLWIQRLTAQGSPAGEASPLTVGIGMRAAALSADGRTLAYARGRRVDNVWRVPIFETGEAGLKDADQLTFDEATVGSIDVDRDGQLVISSERGGSRDLWLVRADGTDMRQLTHDRAVENGPRFSTDGRRIAYSSIQDGNSDIWVRPLERGPATRLTTHPLPDVYPSWSPDDRMIAFYGARGGGVAATLFVVPVSGGEPHQITTSDVSKYFPQWSPDGKWFYYASGFERPSGVQIFRMAVEGGTPEQVTKAPAYYSRWSADGTRLYFPGNERGSSDLWELTIATSRERRLTRFPRDIGELGRYALAASRTHLYFTLRKDVGEIWVMDVAANDAR